MKLYSDSAQKLSIYENGQTSLREHMSGNAVSAADFIKQAGEDFLKLGDEAKVQVTALREEINAKNLLRMNWKRSIMDVKHFWIWSK